MHDIALDECIEPTSVRNLFVGPATIDLAGAEIELVPAFSRELRLRRALAEVTDSFDYTLIDCPPSLGLLTVNALAAATELIVPIQCEYYALEGLSQLLRNVNLVQSNLNPGLDISSTIITHDVRRPDQAGRPGRQRGQVPLPATRCAATRGPAHRSVVERHRSGNRSPCSTLRPEEALSLTGNWPRR